MQLCVWNLRQCWTFSTLCITQNGEKAQFRRGWADGNRREREPQFFYFEFFCVFISSLLIGMTKKKGKQGRWRNTWEDAADVNVQIFTLTYIQSHAFWNPVWRSWWWKCTKIFTRSLLWGCLHLNRAAAAALHFSTWNFNELRVYLLCEQAMVATATSRNPTCIHYRSLFSLCVAQHPWHDKENCM